MKRIVSFILSCVFLMTLGSCIWVHDREGEGHERRERYEHERHEHEHEGGEHHEFEERR